MALVVSRKTATASVMPRVRWLWTMAPWNQLCSVARAGRGSASHRLAPAMAVSSGLRAERRPNQNRATGGMATITSSTVVSTASTVVKRARLRAEPRSSSRAMTTSLAASPTLRNRKSRPETTGQAASDSSARGMRLSVAPPMGWASRFSSEVNARGV